MVPKEKLWHGAKLLFYGLYFRIPPYIYVLLTCVYKTKLMFQTNATEIIKNPSQQKDKQLTSYYNLFFKFQIGRLSSSTIKAETKVQKFKRSPLTVQMK